MHMEVKSLFFRCLLGSPSFNPNECEQKKWTLYPGDPACLNCLLYHISKLLVRLEVTSSTSSPCQSEQAAKSIFIEQNPVALIIPSEHVQAHRVGKVMVKKVKKEVYKAEREGAVIGLAPLLLTSFICARRRAISSYVRHCRKAGAELSSWGSKRDNLTFVSSKSSISWKNMWFIGQTWGIVRLWNRWSSHTI